MADLSIKSALNYAIDWLQARINERTSWDGITIIIISILAMIASPLVKYAAWIGLDYGAWTFWKSENTQ